MVGEERDDCLEFEVGEEIGFIGIEIKEVIDFRDLEWLGSIKDRRVERFRNLEEC